jgi:hypothetical protein
VWQIIKVDFMTAIGWVMQGDVSKLHLHNSAYITPIHKMAEAVEVKDYRPISLIHSFAKIITKVLASRLADKLPSLVSQCQSAFVKGRCIHDNFILVQQTARALHRQKDPRVLLKLDISKVFDSVAWPFLLEVLKHLGFCHAQYPVSVTQKQSCRRSRDRASNNKRGRINQSVD